MSARPWILGISASHNGAACVIHGEEIVVAVQEERLSRRKRDRIEGGRRSLAVRYCLEHARISPRDLDMVVYSSTAAVADPNNDITLSPDLQICRNGLAVETISHHLAHAVSAYALSGFDDAAVLVVDGAGSPVSDLSEAERGSLLVPVDEGRETISIYGASGASLTPLEKHTMPPLAFLDFGLTKGMPKFASLGAMYSAAAQQIFGDPLEAGKVMGLAGYGVADIDPGELFSVIDSRFVFHDAVPRRFPHAERWPQHQRAYQDLAASVQRALEVALDHLTARCRALCPSEHLAYAGGVALNSIANERIIARSGYRRVFVVPPAEDSGAAVGAAFHGLYRITGGGVKRRLAQDGFGRPYAQAEIDEAIRRAPAVEIIAASDPVAAAADLLAEGKAIGWFHGRSELGPRALGQRSILCDPRRPDAKDDLNRRIKFREAFRPFAPAILREHAAAWFDVGGDPDSPFMLRVCPFKPGKAALVPAVAHVDGSARLQTVTEAANPPLYALIRAFFERTGVPILLNTSFNVMGEPIVETPEDAIFCLLATGLDACVIEGRIVRKQRGLRSLLDLRPRRRIASVRRDVALDGGGAARIGFDHHTPWGIVEERLPADLLPILELADGSRDGHAILASIQRSDASMAEDRLIRGLAALRRAGAIAFIV